jgi:hypothetical protein
VGSEARISAQKNLSLLPVSTDDLKPYLGTAQKNELATVQVRPLL